MIKFTRDNNISPPFKYRNGKKNSKEFLDEYLLPRYTWRLFRVIGEDSLDENLGTMHTPRTYLTEEVNESEVLKALNSESGLSLFASEIAEGDMLKIYKGYVHASIKNVSRPPEGAYLFLEFINGQWQHGDFAHLLFARTETIDEGIVEV